MNSNAPLRGVKVLDLTRLLPGPVCTLHLADLGADVIKIEDTGAGDYAAPAVRALVNRNKRGIRLDLKQPDGVQAFMRLAATADAIVEGFRPGVVQRLGIDYDAVARINPRIVYCSITGYGQTGPLRDAAGHDLNYCGYAGVTDQIGTVDADGVHAPALSNVPIADLMGGSLTAVMGVLAALFDAARSGQGRYVDVSISDGVLAHAVLPLATLTTHGSTRPAGGDTLSGALACYSLYATADGRHLAVAALEKKFWDAFCDVIERPELKPLHRSPDAAVTARVREELAALIGAHPLAWWQDKLRGTDCCVSPVYKLEEALANEHFRARGMVAETVHPAYGRVTHVASPVKMSGFEFKIARQAPAPGAHTDEVLHEAGFDAPAIASLKQRGIAQSAC
jgi:crotonobetainyl-CoA:carnitine CoA-transferase CaiB-like acyl-CoA transferase